MQALQSVLADAITKTRTLSGCSRKVRPVFKLGHCQGSGYQVGKTGQNAQETLPPRSPLLAAGPRLDVCISRSPRSWQPLCRSHRLLSCDCCGPFFDQPLSYFSQSPSRRSLPCPGRGLITGAVWDSSQKLSGIPEVACLETHGFLPISNWAIAEKKISSCQKGFLPVNKTVTECVHPQHWSHAGATQRHPPRCTPGKQRHLCGTGYLARSSSK